MSTASNTTINTTVSVKSIASTFSKRTSQRYRKALSATVDDGFATAFSSTCQDIGITNIPIIKMITTEPQSWLSQQCALEKSRSALSSARVPSERSRTLAYSRSSKGSTQIFDSKNKMYAIYNDAENPSTINMLICKNFRMENDVLGALQKTLSKFPTLKTLKLEYCNLTSDQLKAIKYLLNQLDTLVEVSLDGNPISYQNFYILLKNTKLLSLSLRFCKINNKGIAKIGEYLTYPSAASLFAIDLSNNFITDAGCTSLGNALRTNRSLTHLSVADNSITDRGCIYLIAALHKFALSQEEILLRRKCNMDYLLRKKLVTDERRSKLRLSGVSLKATENSKTDKRSRSFNKTKKEKASSSSISSLKKQKIRKKVVSEADIDQADIPKDPHPYMHECTAENNEIYCRGNFRLSYLNLAYNNITFKGILAIKDMLKYQYVTKTSNQDLAGLSAIVFDGNRLDDCGELNDIMELLQGDQENVPSCVASTLSMKKVSKKVSTLN